MKRRCLILIAIFCGAALLDSACSVSSSPAGRAEQAMSSCSCDPGFHCEFYSEDPNPHCEADGPPPPRVVYVAPGQACGIVTDEQGGRTDFRCRLDAHCADGICVCTFFPGGACGPITCPEGTFCVFDAEGDYSCGRYAGDCP